MAKILVNFGVPPEGFYDTLGKHELFIPPAGETFSSAELASILPGVDGVVACKPFTMEMMEAAPRLRIIACYGAGYDHIDLRAATERGIWVANTPDAVTIPTAELAVALMMALARRIPQGDAALRGEAPSSAFVMGKNMGVSLYGSVLGVVGMGRIGARVADLAQALGMGVLYACHSPKPNRDALGNRFVPLPELMAQADFISVHCPHNPRTTGLISGEMLSLMKPTAYLINTARGPIVDEAALLCLLKARAIAGAALDVFTGEPNINPGFFTLNNVLLSPHQGSNTEGARRAMAQETGRRILSVLDGQVPQNLLNPDARPGA